MDKMNEYCVRFMNKTFNGENVGFQTQANFVESINDCHARGFYLVYSKLEGCWKVTNKNPEKLQHQKDNLDLMLKSLFIAQ